MLTTIPKLGLFGKQAELRTSQIHAIKFNTGRTLQIELDRPLAQSSSWSQGSVDKVMAISKVSWVRHQLGGVGDTQALGSIND